MYPDQTVIQALYALHTHTTLTDAIESPALALYLVRSVLRGWNNDCPLRICTKQPARARAFDRLFVFNAK